jgi:cytosine/adenosine deaminase-related metal-dependent hydrolase
MAAPRALTADLVFVGEGDALRDGAIVLDERGEILDAGVAADVLPRNAGARVERHRGLLMPGLVNAHTHIELSHLRGKAPGGAGFIPWATGMLAARAKSTEEDVAEAIDDAVRELRLAGTVAVGDVSNSLGAVRSLSRASIGGEVFHEVFGYDRDRALARVNGLADEVREAVGTWPATDLAYAPAPHTLYTLHPDVVVAAVRAARDRGAMTTLHLAEHAGEREFLERGTGPVAAFAERMGAHAFPIPHASPIDLAQRLGVLAPDVLCVHLTVATRAELGVVAKSGAPVVICPRSNLHIETRMPPLLPMLEEGIVPALGTDSLASCSTLDVLAEAKSIAERFASVPAHVILRMATTAGADALRRPDLGRFRKGARPGVLLVEGDVSASADPLRLLLMRPPSARRWLDERKVAA